MYFYFKLKLSNLNVLHYGCPVPCLGAKYRNGAICEPCVFIVNLI